MNRFKYMGRTLTAPFIKIGMFLVSITVPSVATLAQEWKALGKDGVHDPHSVALQVLQNPGEALSVLPKDTAGNKVDWISALRDGYIKPRSYLNKPVEDEIRNSTILFKETGDMPYVLFPHQPHTEWLACANCHERIFKSKEGASPVNMFEILQGKYCGECHGAVSFPLTECKRCHSVPRELNHPTK